MTLFNKIREQYEKNTRYILALFVLLVTFIINQHFFNYKKITTEDCKGGKCLSENTENSQLSAKNPFYYFEDTKIIAADKFYRLIFREKSTLDSTVVIKLAKQSDEEKEIRLMDLPKSEDFSYQEIVFQTHDNFSSLFFEKKNPNDGAEVFLDEIKLSQLNISSENELASLKATLIGESNFDLVNQEQTTDASYKFPPFIQKTVMGQIFRSDSDYMSGIRVNFDITKEEELSSKRYVVKIKKIISDNDFQDNGIKIKDIPAANFSCPVEDLEKYRQLNGTFKFPLFARLEKGAYYFVSVDNKEAGNNKFNYIQLRGSKDDNSYSEGTAAVMIGNQVYKIDGDLYFAIYGAEFRENSANQKMLTGSTIEDLGKNEGAFNYRTSGTPTDLLDIATSSNDIDFNSGKKIIYGSFDTDSYYIYDINTPYPLKRLFIEATQATANWPKVKIFYSFDQKKWAEIPFTLQNEVPPISTNSTQDSTLNNPSANDKNLVQIFKTEIDGVGLLNKVFLKIKPDPTDIGSGNYYGIKNLKITGYLILK